jgi:hypothetical protein
MMEDCGVDSFGSGLISVANSSANKVRTIGFHKLEGTFRVAERLLDFPEDCAIWRCLKKRVYIFFGFDIFRRWNSRVFYSGKVIAVSTLQSFNFLLEGYYTMSLPGVYTFSPPAPYSASPRTLPSSHCHFLLHHRQ